MKKVQVEFAGNFRVSIVKDAPVDRSQLGGVPEFIRAMVVACFIERAEIEQTASAPKLSRPLEAVLLLAASALYRAASWQFIRPA